MEYIIYGIPAFKGFSAIENRTVVEAADMQNFIVRETSLQTRNGCTMQVAAVAGVPGCLFLFKEKGGTKHFMMAEGANLWASNSGFTEWNTPALKANCANANFGHTVYQNKVYLANGVDALVFDGTTLAAMAGTLPSFDMVVNHKYRLWSNDLADPTYLHYSDILDPTTLKTSNYFQISDNTGDGIKAACRVLTHLFILNEYSAYALYGSGGSDTTKSFVADIGCIAKRSLTLVNETAFWLSHRGVCSYSGSGIQPMSLQWGDIENIVNMDYVGNAVACGYDNCYWLALPESGQTTNNAVYLYDTQSKEWTIFRFPFSIIDFCVDGDKLYCVASDKKTYRLNYGTTDAGTDITARWISDAMDFQSPGRLKRLKYCALELADIAAGGTVDAYTKEDAGAFGSATSYTIPTGSPGATVSEKIKTGRFYNLSLKLEVTGPATINNITFGAKAKAKVK